ncbi:hypothetical protein JAAARDRAFT_661581 [Jaapia argillacea MUCL 33604]|uniref:Uncharacterized protein n=1 Tax=Jaapia argillacea MUCL 33604 TaxID=933084 RepID=A0A067P3B4_9AGAM|nr:hypothetical protein JAAARDRAFT_661581 [Jaapia argillacea MUCL 33604]
MEASRVGGERHRGRFVLGGEEGEVEDFMKGGLGRWSGKVGEFVVVGVGVSIWCGDWRVWPWEECKVLITIGWEDLGGEMRPSNGVPVSNISRTRMHFLVPIKSSTLRSTTAFSFRVHIHVRTHFHEHIRPRIPLRATRNLQLTSRPFALSHFRLTVVASNSPPPCRPLGSSLAHTAASSRSDYPNLHDLNSTRPDSLRCFD